MKKIVVRTSDRTEMVDITHEIRRYVSDEDVVNGLVVVYVPHTTAGVTINEGVDPAVQQDIVSFLNGLIPEDSGFRHSEGNSDAHIKASLVGSSVSIIVQQGELVLGTWQHVFFFEADGPRSRQVYISHVSGGHQ
jgi:secondary thiamine-phosphate synthase enzyme